MKKTMVRSTLFVKRGILFTAWLVGVAAFSGLHATTYDNFYVFGDSLSDIGNDFILTGNDPAFSAPFSPRYADGRFSNGLIWSDYLAAAWGITIKPSLASSNLSADLAAGTNVSFAYGGAGSQNGDNLTPGLFAVPGARKQVGQYAAALGAASLSAEADALHVIWTGANDYLLDPSLGVTPNPVVSVGNIADAVDDLYAVGARNVTVLNLPDLGNTPIARMVGAEVPLSAATAEHNALLSMAVADLAAMHPDLGIDLIDVHALFEQILSDPLGFGFSTDQSAGPAAPCLFDPSPTNCAPISFETDMFWWDEQHPSTNSQLMVAGLVSVPVPVPGTVLLLGVGIAGMAHARRRHASARPGRIEQGVRSAVQR